MPGKGIAIYRDLNFSCRGRDAQTFLSAGCSTPPGDKLPRWEVFAGIFPLVLNPPGNEVLSLPLALEISQAGWFFPRAEHVFCRSTPPESPPLLWGWYPTCSNGPEAVSCPGLWKVPVPSQGTTCRSPNPVTHVPK